ncbi:MAG: hypothetical protein HFJ28_04185 [Clostridia bacterium]|jgi:hypothetical protein|nr:hypothetical protein [Clostridia bacterium]
MFYGSGYTLYTGSERYYSLQASAGMYYNFGTIKFRYASSAGNNYNQGYYKSIINGATYNSATGSSTTQTATKLFVKSGVATNVRLIALPEIEKRVGSLRFGFDDITDKMDPYGVFDLEYLKQVPVLGKISMSSSYRPFWIASPYRQNTWGSNEMIAHMGYGGKGKLASSMNEEFAVRPVVSLSGSRLKLTELENGVYTLK